MIQVFPALKMMISWEGGVPLFFLLASFALLLILSFFHQSFAVFCAMIVINSEPCSMMKKIK